jgi:hypothetical protein
MPINHAIQAFETVIAYHLTTAGGYENSNREDFDRERCPYRIHTLSIKI